ncbi:hypothetical protein GYMLUDRAFT_252785 [Collybiopsis luxurians FD-317 M1]|uniref:Uncharacterized protein n=1 Tax=Collybiopsis luxurians FD-317 M1 TaxID=944289 RepID=A0A0D0BMF1_9AGAR|nr:hypothetical protein GYMLUDRAFT_252785 [Collybiopsis luxurians FD-317 M1]
MPENGYTYQIHWKGWICKEDATSEEATSLVQAGDALTGFWLTMETEQTFKPLEEETVFWAKKKYIAPKLKESKQVAVIQPLPYKVIELPPEVASEPGNTSASEPPYPDVVVADPQMLWLPPDRVGLDPNDRTLLYQTICNTLGSVGVDGNQFYKALKKDRRESHRRRAMGITYAWKLIRETAVQCDLAEYALSQGFIRNYQHGRAFLIGVNAM